jgi:hypothetical protein
MSKFSDLVAHITNLKDSNIAEATLDVNYLFEALSEITPPSNNGDSGVPVDVSVELDGGQFGKQ